jgi:hypothetical protein
MTVKTGLNANTPDRIMVDAGAIYLNYGLTTERLLGATRGGNEFNLNRTVRDVEVDGVMGSTKGLRRVVEVRPQLTCNLIELSLDNLLKAIAGASSEEAKATEIVDAEYLGEGSGEIDSFTVAHFPVVANSEKVYVDGVLKTKGEENDYTINYTTGVITFKLAGVPTTGEHVTISYVYETGDSATHDTIAGGQIDGDSYVDNVALVGNISGKTQPVICIVKNALADTGFSISTAPRDEAVPTIVWTGHYDPADPDTEPWLIKYPRS